MNVCGHRRREVDGNLSECSRCVCRVEVEAEVKAAADAFQAAHTGEPPGVDPYGLAQSA